MIWRKKSGKPLPQGFSDHPGVKEIYQPLYQKLVDDMVRSTGLELEDSCIDALCCVLKIPCLQGFSSFSVLMCTVVFCRVKGKNKGQNP